MAKDVWIAKPNEIVKANTPEELVRQGVVVYPFSLCKLWGKNAASRYMKAQGMTETAIIQMTKYHNKSASTVSRSHLITSVNKSKYTQAQ